MNKKPYNKQGRGIWRDQDAYSDDYNDANQPSIITTTFRHV